jgi:hypothetical protein
VRTFRHWTPRYIYSRILEKHYRRTHPGLPWLTQEANRILETLLLPQDVGLECGSGRSTLWFAARVSHLTSVEHNPQWHARVAGWLDEKQLANVDYHLCPGSDSAADLYNLPAYVRIVDDIPPNSLDFALVDGIFRDACALLALDRLKAGGFLVIDNANLYLPCESHAPNSKREADGPASLLWAQFLQKTAGWRTIWTSNGVSDTAFFFKGHSS